MATTTLPRALPYNPAPRRIKRLKELAGHVSSAAKQAIRKVSATPLARHFADNAYSLLGFGFLDVAGFVHSPFTGFIVTGVSFLAFEWKVSE